MTKSDLENGMVVETRNRDRYLVHNGKFIGAKYYNVIGNNYTNELNHTKLSSYDIVKVYKSNAYKLDYIFDSVNLELIWERKNSVKRKNSVIGQILEIVKRYENDRYICPYRYYCEEIDTEEKESYILDEIKELLNNLGIEYKISNESGIDTCSFSEDFYSVAWIEDGKLKQYTFICECR